MQACKLIMFHYACTHVRSGVWSGSAAKGVLNNRKRAQIGAPVRKGTHTHVLSGVQCPSNCRRPGVPGVRAKRPGDVPEAWYNEHGSLSQFHMAVLCGAGQRLEVP